MGELRETLKELSAEKILSSRLLKRALKAETKLDDFNDYNLRLIGQCAEKDKRIAELTAKLDAVRKEGICLWNWAHNWDSPFIEDEHWRVTDAPRIYAALRGKT